MCALHMYSVNNVYTQLYTSTHVCVYNLIYYLINIKFYLYKVNLEALSTVTLTDHCDSS